VNTSTVLISADQQKFNALVEYTKFGNDVDFRDGLYGKARKDSPIKRKGSVIIMKEVIGVMISII
jgi:hypothetical protein